MTFSSSKGQSRHNWWPALPSNHPLLSFSKPPWTPLQLQYQHCSLPLQFYVMQPHPVATMVKPASTCIVISVLLHSISLSLKIFRKGLGFHLNKTSWQGDTSFSLVINPHCQQVLHLIKNCLPTLSTFLPLMTFAPSAAFLICSTFLRIVATLLGARF